MEQFKPEKTGKAIRIGKDEKKEEEEKKRRREEEEEKGRRDGEKRKEKRRSKGKERNEKRDLTQKCRREDDGGTADTPESHPQIQERGEDKEILSFRVRNALSEPQFQHQHRISDQSGQSPSRK